jgi:hypothetical protein
MAMAKLVAAGTWEDMYYAQSGKYGSLYEVREALPRLRSASILDWNDVSRGVEVRTSVDGSAYLVVAREQEYGIECAMYERKSTDVLATNADAPFQSQVYDMQGWPDDLSAIECRRTRFPWPLLHWMKSGYLSSDEVSSGLRSVGSQLSW